ncbi:MAG: hypothetical protein NTY30_01565 [Candidatus Berkelbacteria bacterium]|nr:hypothetical protein [Candidatus Berkelbacteria bacterium]
MWKKVLQSVEEYYLAEIENLQKRIDENATSAANSPGSMQSWSDKSKQEFTQLAEALSKDIPPLQLSLKQISAILESGKIPSKNISVGSIVKVQYPDEPNDEYLVIVPTAGGNLITVDDKDFFLLSEKSDLGKSLLNKKLNDKVNLKSGSEVLITEVINS